MVEIFFVVSFLFGFGEFAFPEVPAVADLCGLVAFVVLCLFDGREHVFRKFYGRFVWARCLDQQDMTF